MRVNQVPASPRAGSMLEVELTARAALPQAMVSQTLVLLGERYRFKGKYMSDRMRTKQGLAWALRCGNGGGRWAQTRTGGNTALSTGILKLSLEFLKNATALFVCNWKPQHRGRPEPASLARCILMILN